MYRKSYVMPARGANKISRLSIDSDSESDSDESSASASSGSSASSVGSVEERVSSLAAPSSHAAFASQETSPAFRVWKADEGESRFTTEKNNIFSSPFSRKKVAWSRPRFRSEDSTTSSLAASASASASASACAEGWVSIEKGISCTDDDDLPAYAPPTPKTEEGDDLPVVAKPSQEFPSLLKRGSGSVEDQQNALAWAEKIKKNLDNAEKMRAVNKKQKEGLSFFKRGVSGLQ